MVKKRKISYCKFQDTIDNYKRKEKTIKWFIEIKYFIEIKIPKKDFMKFLAMISIRKLIQTFFHFYKFRWIHWVQLKIVKQMELFKFGNCIKYFIEIIKEIVR